MKTRTLIVATVLLLSINLLAETVQIGNLYFSTNYPNATLLQDPSTGQAYYKALDTVVVPATFTYDQMTFTVTAVGTSAFEGCTELRSVTLPNTLLSIGQDAFYNCSKLTSVNLPEGLTTIGQRAFRGCAISSVTVPSTVTSLGNYVFNACPALTSVVWNAVNASIPSSSEAAPFYGCRTTITSFVFGDQVQKVPGYLCAGLLHLDTIVLPNSVTSIGSYAFYNCSSLKSINLPEGLTSLPTSLFENCSALDSISIPASVTTINQDAFYNCSSLAKVNLDEGLKTVGQRAFRGCAMRAVTVPSTVTSLGQSTFAAMPNLKTVVWNAKRCTTSYSTDTYAPFVNSTAITSFTLGDSVQIVPPYLCYNMRKVSSIAIPETVTSIGSYAFNNCVLLESVHLPNSVTSIGSYAFAFCTALTHVHLPEGITTLPSSLFEGCTALPSISIPASVTTINQDAFYNCSALQSIYNYALTPQTIQARVFYNVDKTTCLLYVPEETYDQYAVKAVWMDFLNRIAIEPALRFEDRYAAFSYLGQDADTLHSEQLLLHMPIAPTLDGFTFLRWEVVAGDFEDGIVLQAVYEAAEATDVEQLAASASSPHVRKLLKDGNVYILRDDKRFTVTGRRVK